MKILLLKPILDQVYVLQPYLGLGYLATIIEQNGHQVQYLDACKENLTWDSFELLARREQWDLVGIQCLSPDVPPAYRHTAILKKVNPETLVMVGGAHISGDPVGSMHYISNVDFAIAGEAEVGIDQMTRLRREDLDDPDKLKTISGLLWRHDGQIIQNPSAPVPELDDIKMPAWHLMPPASYPVSPHGNFVKKTPTAPILTSRGCPYSCVFCAGHTITGKRIRTRSISNIREELLLLYHEYGVREFHIEDEVFTMKKEHVTGFCEMVQELDLDMAFALPNGVRLDSLTPELVQMMEKTGFYSMGLGIESGSDRILKVMRKHLSCEQTREQIKMIKQNSKIHLTGFFLMGHPEETVEDIESTARFARSLPIDKANFLFLFPLPGTPIWEEYRKTLDGPIDWEQFLAYQMTEGLSPIPPEQLHRLQRRAILAFYLRPRIVLQLLRQIKSFNQFKILWKRFLMIFIKSGRKKPRPALVGPSADIEAFPESPVPQRFII